MVAHEGMPTVYVYRSTGVQGYECTLHSMHSMKVYRPRGLVIRVAPETSAQGGGSEGSERGVGRE